MYVDVRIEYKYRDIRIRTYRDEKIRDCGKDSIPLFWDDSKNRRKKTEYQ